MSIFGFNIIWLLFLIPSLWWILRKINFSKVSPLVNLKGGIVAIGASILVVIGYFYLTAFLLGTYEGVVLGVILFSVGIFFPAEIKSSNGKKTTKWPRGAILSLGALTVVGALYFSPTGKTLENIISPCLEQTGKCGEMLTNEQTIRYSALPNNNRIGLLPPIRLEAGEESVPIGNYQRKCLLWYEAGGTARSQVYSKIGEGRWLPFIQEKSDYIKFDLPVESGYVIIQVERRLGGDSC